MNTTWMVCLFGLSVTSMTYGGYLLYRVFRVKHWVRVPGRVNTIRAEPTGMQDMTVRYRLAVTYGYRVNDEPFVGDRIAVGPLLEFNSEEAALTYAKKRYPRGELIHVFVDPNDPYRAVLDARIGAVGVLAICCSLVSLGAAIALLRSTP